MNQHATERNIHWRCHPSVIVTKTAFMFDAVRVHSTFGACETPSGGTIGTSCLVKSLQWKNRNATKQCLTKRSLRCPDRRNVHNFFELDRMAHKVPISQKSETLTCWKGRNPLIPKRTPHSNNYNILPIRAHNACLEAKMPWRTLDDQLPPNPLSKRVLWASGDRNNNPRALTRCEMKIAT